MKVKELSVLAILRKDICIVDGFNLLIPFLNVNLKRSNYVWKHKHTSSLIDLQMFHFVKNFFCLFPAFFCCRFYRHFVRHILGGGGGACSDLHFLTP
jgi:hypothetical protein